MAKSRKITTFEFKGMTFYRWKEGKSIRVSRTANPRQRKTKG
jgi:hypothetical protein